MLCPCVCASMCAYEDNWATGYWSAEQKEMRWSAHIQHDLGRVKRRTGWVLVYTNGDPVLGELGSAPP